MNILDNIYGAFDYIFSNWLISLFLIFAVLVVLSIFFKGFKLSVWLISFGAVVAALGFVASLVIQMLKWDLIEIIDFVVKWGPTILFVSIVLIAMLTGARRGLRKSLILYAHALIAGGISVGLYFYFVHSESFDSLLLSIVNSIMGSTGALQDRFNLDPSINKMSDVLVELILLMFKDGEYAVILRENAAYLYALADTVYHIIFAIVAIIIYNIIKAFFYLLYLIIYPERRYKKRKERDFSKRLTDKTYKKRRIGGSVVGLVRGGLLSLVILSYLGSTLFLFVGTGAGKLKDYDLGDENTNYYYSIFRSIESYGTNGIYKVLNMLSDEEGTPYYLFAADLVFSGELEIDGEDPEHIKWRDEIGNLTTFARDTFDLMMEYGSEQLKPILSGESNDFNPVVEVLSNPDFQTKFNKLIADYKDDTHVVNLSLALAQSLVDHIDELSVGESLGETKEVVKLVFSKGYLSEKIPEDKALIAETGKTVAEGEDVRPYIPVKNLIKKSDIQLVLNVMFKYISNGYDEDDLTMVRQLVGDLRGFSLFSDGRSAELDPVFSRLFCLVDNMYLSGEEGMTYAEVKDFDVKWTSEINGLIDVIESGIQLFQNVKPESEGEGNILDSFFTIFDVNDKNYDQNHVLYETVTKRIYDSQVVAIAVSTSYTYNLLSDALKEVYSDVYLSHNMTFTNVYNDDGSIQTEGELYLLFNGLARIGGNRELVDMFTNIGDDTDITALLDSLADTLVGIDNNGHDLVYYVSTSSMLRSIMTAVLTNLDTEYIYIPDAAFETENGEKINVITKGEVEGVLKNIRGLSDVLKPILDVSGDGNGDSAEMIDKISAALDRIGIDSVIEMTDNSKILEGSVSSILNSFLKNTEIVVIPKAESENLELWVSNGTVSGELRKMLEAIKSLDLDFSKLLDDNGGKKELLNEFLNLTDEKLDTILKSKVLHYTISNILISGDESLGLELDLIVPYEVRRDLGADDVIKSVVREDELKTVFSEIRDFDLIDPDTNEIRQPEIGDLLAKVASKADSLDNSKIVFVFIVNTIVNNDTNGLVGALGIPQKYMDGASRESLERMRFTGTTAERTWRDELPALIKAMDEFLGITKASADGGKFEYNSDKFTKENLSEVFKSLTGKADLDAKKTKLDVVYSSEIFKNKVTVELDNLLGGFEAFADSGRLNAAKEGGYYAKNELISLANAVDIFGFDLTTGGSAESLSSNITTLNEPYKETGKTKLEAVYSDSKLVARMFTYEIDKSLVEGNLAAESVVSNAGKRNNAKTVDGNYSVAELQRFIDAANLIGIGGITDSSAIDFSENVKKLVVAGENGEIPLEKVYTSTIAAGVISYRVESALKDGNYSAHGKAFESELKILRYDEIYSLLCLDFLGSDGAFDGTAIDVDSVGNLIYDGEGKTSSYLLVGILSDMICVNASNFTVVDEAKEGGYIMPREIRTLLDVFSAVGGEGADFGEFDLGGEIPAKETLELMYDSILCRVKVTEIIISSTSGNEGEYNKVYVSQQNGSATAADGVRRLDRYHANGGTVLTLTTVELRAFVDAMESDLFADVFGDSFEIPEFSMDMLEGFSAEQIDVLFKSEMMYYQICGAINFNLKQNEAVQTYIQSQYGHREDVINVTESTGSQIKNSAIICYQASDIKAICDYYRLAMAGGIIPSLP